MDNVFFCYSKRLFYFLSAVDISYTKHSFNGNNNHEYWCYKKDDNLSKALVKWEEIKQEFNLMKRNK